MTDFSLKHPPTLHSDEEYETWKRDVTLWCELTVPVEKQAISVNLCLKGRARIAASEIPIADLKKTAGFDTLIERLDDLFLADKGSRQFAVFSEFYKTKKSDGQTLDAYISSFEHVCYKMEAQDMKLPDAVTAFMLLESCNFSDTEKKLVMSSIPEVSYDNMKVAIKRIFGEIAGNKVAMEIKDEPVFQSEAFYLRGNARGRGAFQRGRGRGNTLQRGGNASRGSKRKLNPLDKNGNPTKCVICGSKYHWANSCPDSYENCNATAGTEENRNNTGNSDAGALSDGEENEVHFTLFGFYADKHNKKLSKLVDECQGCALLDSGCSKTVAGLSWYTKYFNELSDYDKKTVTETSSNSLFTFGDGECKRSMKCVVMPCYIDGKRSTMEVEIVEGGIPLLLSRNSMKKGKMILDFENDMLVIGDRSIKLRMANSGHYLLPLY